MKMRLLAIALFLCLVFTLLPIQAFAESEDAMLDKPATAENADEDSVTEELVPGEYSIEQFALEETILEKVTAEETVDEEAVEETVIEDVEEEVMPEEWEEDFSAELQSTVESSTGVAIEEPASTKIKTVVKDKVLAEAQESEHSMHIGSERSNIYAGEKNRLVFEIIAPNITASDILNLEWFVEDTDIAEFETTPSCNSWSAVVVGKNEGHTRAGAIVTYMFLGEVRSKYVACGIYVGENTSTFIMAFSGKNILLNQTKTISMIVRNENIVTSIDKITWEITDTTVAEFVNLPGLADQTVEVKGLKEGKINIFVRVVYNGGIVETYGNGFMVVCEEESPLIFSDVADPSRYYYTPVYWAVDNDITVGYGGPNLFSPDAPCTREQIVTFLWRLMKEPEPLNYDRSFVDVPSDKWYYKPIMWAASTGITTGYADGSGRFGIGDPCAREQCVTFLWRAAGNPTVGTHSNFTDVSSDRYFYDSISWAAGKNITVGLNDGTGRFGVGMICSRAMIVTLLYRYNSVR